MSFDIKDFVNTNRVILIWVAFGGLIYIFRNMFGLIFLTYIMCFIAHSITRFFYRKIPKITRKFLIVILYCLFLIAITALFFLAIPRVFNETKNFAQQLPQTIEAFNMWLDKLVAENPSLAPSMERIKEYITVETIFQEGLNYLRHGLEQLIHYFSWFLLSLLFSFLIMLDLPNLYKKTRKLRYTKAATIYAETVDSVVLFAKVVGTNFRAQIFISTINTFLTAIFLKILGIESIALLCSLVFLCGLIPVLGVFISSVPIILVALNIGGINKAFLAIGMIIFIHALEAYVLNPRIVSAIMRINPVVTLIILYIAHSIMGLWGMLLGVPISVYIYRQIIIGDSGKLKNIPSQNQDPEIEIKIETTEEI